MGREIDYGERESRLRSADEKEARAKARAKEEKERRKAEKLATRNRVGDPFEVEPVPLKTFVSDKGYLNNPPLSPIQFDAVRHMEQIYLPETHLLLEKHLGSKKWEYLRMVHRIALEWGKGSGKDHVCRIALARWVYLMQCLKDPLSYWSIPPQDYIHFLNIAASQGQATRAFFMAFRNLVKAAPCFADKFQVVHGSRGMGGEVRQTGGEPGKFEIEFDKHIMAISGHSGSASQEGLNLLGALADEIAAFRTRDEVLRSQRTSMREPENTADAVVDLMLTSARTRFPSSFKNAYISFPRFEGDAIEQLVAKGRLSLEEQGEDSEWYVSGPLPTWEVNPRVPDRSVFDEDYREDRAMAEAKYECRPGLATNRYFRDDQAIYAAFARKVEVTPVHPTFYWGFEEGFRPNEEPDALAQVEGWQVRYEFADDFLPYRGSAYAIHGDMALNGDRAGIAMSHIRKWERKEWRTVHGEVLEPRAVVKMDFALTLSADLSVDPPREVQLRWFRSLIWQLINRGFAIERVTMDGWQSLDTLQILEARGIETERVSCDVPQTQVWKTFGDLMYDGRFEGYYDELLINEVRGLRQLPNGKVDHADGGSKDMIDAVAASSLGALEAGGSGEGDNPVRADTSVVDLFGLHQGRGIPELMPSGGLFSTEEQARVKVRTLPL